MVGETKNNNKNSVELEASLAPVEAEVGALTKADQYLKTVEKSIGYLLWETI